MSSQEPLDLEESKTMKKEMKVGKRIVDITGWDQSSIDVLKAYQDVHKSLDDVFGPEK
jgi:hypothetical protein